MRNPFRFQVESYTGAFLMFALGAFFIAFLYISLKNFDTDIETIDSQHAAAKIKTVSPAQRELIDIWMKENDMSFPEGESYRWLLKAYPKRPWLKE